MDRLVVEMERLLEELARAEPGSPEYKSVLDSYNKLASVAIEFEKTDTDRVRVDTEKRRWGLDKEKFEHEKSKRGLFNVDRDLLGQIGGQLLGTTLVMLFEQSFVFRTKGLSFIPKIWGKR